MKWVINEPLKYRLIGLIVFFLVLSLIIFLLSKVAHKPEKKLELMAIPLPKERAIAKQDKSSSLKANQQNDFEPIKIAKIELPEVKESKLPTIEKSITAPVNTNEVINNPVTILAEKKVSIKTLPASSASKILIEKKIVSTKTVLIRKTSHYGVQVALFKQAKNAGLLISKLKRKGYLVRKNLYKDHQGQLLYKIIVGDFTDKNKAIGLQKNLVATLNLKGFIVPVGAW